MTFNGGNSLAHGPLTGGDGQRTMAAGASGREQGDRVEVDCRGGRIVLVLDRGAPPADLILEAGDAEDLAFAVLDLVASLRHGWAIQAAPTADAPKGYPTGRPPAAA